MQFMISPRTVLSLNLSIDKPWGLDGRAMRLGLATIRLEPALHWMFVLGPVLVGVHRRRLPKLTSWVGILFAIGTAYCAGIAAFTSPVIAFLFILAALLMPSALASL
jgi:hypothetical protein